MYKFDWNDLEVMSKIQDTYYSEWKCSERRIPLSEIPELTYEIWRDSINHDALSEETKKVTKDATPEELSDWYCDMLENSRICIDTNTVKRWNWYIMYDMTNQVYWKLENDISSNNCIIMDYWSNYVLND